MYMVCRGCPNTYVTTLTTGCPVCLTNWLIIYMYAILMHYCYKLSVTNIYYITLLIKRKYMVIKIIAMSSIGGLYSIATGNMCYIHRKS